MPVTTLKEYREQIVNLIHQARELLIKAGHKVVYEEGGAQVKLVELNIDGEIYRFFGIEQSEQDSIPKANRRAFFERARAAVAKEMHLPTQIKGLQVVGDSAPFGEQESKQATEFLHDILDKNIENNLLLYGFTGNHRFTVNMSAEEQAAHRQVLSQYYDVRLNEIGNYKSPTNHHRLDINQIVNQWILKHPEKAKSVLANIVDLHTPMAVSQWGCDVSHLVRNFFLVFDKNKPSATFGKDIISSDNMTDTLFIADGGMQSLAQGTNVWDSEKKARIISLGNLRGPINDSCFVKKEGKIGQFYSTAELIEYLRKSALSDIVNASNINEWLERYKHLGGVTRHPANPDRADYSTKEALLDLAMKNLVESGVFDTLLNSPNLDMFRFNSDIGKIERQHYPVAIPSSARSMRP